MPDSFSRTPKGQAEFAAKPGKLTPGLKTLLGMVGENTTIPDLKAKLPQVPEDKLTAALGRLAADGYVQRVAQPERMHAESSLDFTRFINRPVKEPTLTQKRQAEATIASIRTSKTAGFQANILNRSAKRIAPHAGGDKHTILVIDADEANALIVTRALLLAKFDTRAAAKREEILQQLNKQPPADAIAMDINLPEVGGLELLGRLRDHPTFKTVPIVVMTAKVEHDDVVAALAYGANGFLTKPLKPEALVESVKAVLGL
jgi:CheY-like chemotaxis protein